MIAVKRAYDLLPRKPGTVEQEEYEERNRVGFQLERIAKNGFQDFVR